MMESEKGESISTGIFSGNALVRGLTDSWKSFSKRKEELGLSNPGSVEGVSRELHQQTLLDNFTFQGLRAEYSKLINFQNPMFQIAHALSIGGNGGSPYTLSTMFSKLVLVTFQWHTGKMKLISNFETVSQKVRLRCLQRFAWSH